MKRKTTILLTILICVVPLLIMSVVSAGTLSLGATWIANTEPDMKEYRLYRTDGQRTLLGSIPHPTVEYLFSVTVPDQSEGTLIFVLTAVDTNNNESLDSVPASYSYNLDTLPPGAPKNVNVNKVTPLAVTPSMSIAPLKSKERR